MSVSFRALSRMSLVLCFLQACNFSNPSAPTGDHRTPERTSSQPPDPQGSGDPSEDRAQAALDAADTENELDGDELGHVSRAADTGGMSMSATCDDDPLGSFDYCSSTCRCGINEGDCDDDGDCDAGLACMRDTGALFGFDPEVDVCMERCSLDALGTPDFCSPECPCEAGQGDCDNNSDCAAGNICAKNVGASFGFAPDVDVCVDICDPIRNGTFDYCSPTCPCEHGQGDCDRDSDCAPGLACTRDAGASFGLDPEVDVCVAHQEGFAGRVLDELGTAVAGASVSINQVTSTSGEDGSFAIVVNAPADGRFVINIEKFGYVPHSSIHLGAGTDDLSLTIARAQIIQVKTTDSEIVDGDGTHIELSAPAQQALVDENGQPPTGAVLAQMHTFDVVAEGMVGNMDAVDAAGNMVTLQSVGAVSVYFVDLDGNKYKLRPGSTAEIAMQLPAGIDYSGPIPLWHYDMEQGRWVEEGQGIVENGMAFGEVTHFSAWNFDVKLVRAACIKVTTNLDPGTSIEARVRVLSVDFPRSQIVTLANVGSRANEHVLFNLPPNVDVQIFVPPDATTPIATPNSGDAWAPIDQPSIGEPPDYNLCKGTAVIPALNGQLRGTVSLQGRADNGGATVRVLRSSDSVEVRSGTTGSIADGANGRYRIEEIPPQTYNIRIEQRGYLPVLMRLGNAVTIDAGKVHHLPCIRLAGGDVIEDGVINTADRNAVIDKLNQTATENDLEDINRDGRVNQQDLDIVASNMGVTGPLSPTDPRSQCPSGNVAAVAAGGLHTCARMNDGKVRCWGGNSLGQLGYGNTNDVGDDETLIGVGSSSMNGSVTQLVVGGYHSCAIVSTPENRVRCWGYNNAGQLGYGNTNDIGDGEPSANVGDIPLVLEVGDSIMEVATGLFHTCVRTANENVHCWGDNSNGQLGYGDTENIGDDEAVSARGAVQVGGDVMQIVAGAFHTCALFDDGRSVKCWGNNQFGQLGYGNTSAIGDNETPATVGFVQATTGSERITKLVAGFYHTCAQLDSLAIRCWGAGDSGQLGYGTTDHVGDTEPPNSRTAVPLANFGRIDIVAGGFHTCALIDDGTGAVVKCWGESAFGKLGYASTIVGDILAPPTSNVSLSGTAASLSAGLHHTCAPLISGSVQCWGRSNRGQLGYGNTNNIGDDELPITAGSVPFLN